jgi:colicin import membrane protein
MTKSSGIAAFDLAVKRAIEKSAPFPPDPATGKVPVNINITHRLKDSDTR